MSTGRLQKPQERFGNESATTSTPSAHLSNGANSAALSQIDAISAAARNANIVNRPGSTFLRSGTCVKSFHGIPNNVSPSIWSLGPSAQMKITPKIASNARSIGSRQSERLQIAINAMKGGARERAPLPCIPREQRQEGLTRERESHFERGAGRQRD